MTLYITINKSQKVLDNTSNGGSSDVIGGQVVSNVPLTTNQATNNVAQTAAWGAGTAAGLDSFQENIPLAYAGVGAGAAAFASGQAVLKDDMAEALSDYQTTGKVTIHDGLAIAGDIITMVGDEALMAGSAVSIIPGLKQFAIPLTLLGDTMGIGGIAIGGIDDPNTLTALPTSIINTGLQAISSFEALLTANNSAAGSALGNNWYMLDNSLTSSLNSAATTLNNLANPALLTDANNTASFLGAVSTPMTNLYYGIGGTATNFTTTATATSTDTSVASTLTGSSSPVDTSNIATSTNGSSTSLNETNTSGSTLYNETDSLNATTGAFTDLIRGNNASGTAQYSQITTTSSAGQASVDITGQGDIDYTNGASVSLANNTQATVDGNNNAITAGEDVFATVNGADTYYVGQDKLSFSSDTLQSFTTDANDNATFAIDSPSSYSENITWSPDTGQAALNLTETDGTIVTTSLGQINSGDVLDVNGSTASLLNASDQAMDSAQVNPDGSFIQTSYNLDPDATWSSQISAYDNDGQSISSATTNADGITDLLITDPMTGSSFSTSLDAQGNPVPASVSSNMDYPGLVSAVIDTLATQLISQVLIKNNLPASIAAEAFASATIKSAISVSTGSFSQDFANSIVNIAGGIAGSDVGVLLAKSLGIPTEAGSLVGGLAGNLLTQAIVNEAAQELGFQALTDITLDATTEQVAGAFGAGLEGAGGGLLGSYLGSLIAGNSTDAQLGSAVGGAAGAYIGSIVPIVGTFIGAVIGSFIGDLIGGLFDPPRGQPFVQATIGISNGQFHVSGASQDNNGNINDAYSIGNSLTSFLNQVLSSIGGTVVGSASWNIGYGDSNGIFSLPSGAWPPSASEKFGSINDAIADAAYHMLRSATIVGGNPIMEWELLTSSATNINGLLSDLGLAQNYVVYNANPLAAYVAIASNGNASDYQNLQNTIATAQTTGLSRLSYDGTTLTITDSVGDIGGDLGVLSRMPGQAYNFAIIDSSGNVMANLGILENLAINGQLASIALTDATTPTLGWSATGIAGYLNVLDAITTPFTVVVTDTAANVSSALTDLQALAANNHLTSITLTDGGKPTLTISAADLSSDAGALSKLTGSYQFAIADTAANVSANFAAIQNLKALGELASLTLTDTGTPVLNLSYAQYTQSTSILSLITAPYKLGLVDTGANVSANIVALQSLAASGKLVSISLTDTTKPNVPVTLAQTTTYASVLAMITGQATITVTNIAANTSYTITDNGLTLPLLKGTTIQSNGTNSFLDQLNGSNLTVTLANGKAVVDSSGNATFTTPLAGFGSSTLKLATTGTAIFTVGSDNLTFQANALQNVSYANGIFDFGIVVPSSAYAENITWNPATGVANLIVTAAGGQPVTTSLGQVNTGTLFTVSGSTTTNTNAAGQKLLSTTVNADGTQADTVYNYSGGANKDTVTTFNTVGQQTSVHWDHNDGSTYTTYVNPTTQAVIANLTVNANGSGSISTANNQTVNFATGNVATVSIGSTGDTLLTIKTLSGSGIVETIDLSSGQIVTTVNGNDPVYTLANGSASIDVSGNLTLTGSGSTLLIPASGANATFTVGNDTLSFPQATLQSVSSINNVYMFGVASSAVGYSESISWDPVSGLANLIMTPTSGVATTTPLGPINQGSVLSVSGSTISITASNGTVVSSTTIATDGSLINSFNNSAGALHTAANGVSTFIYGSDQLIFQPSTLQSYSSANGIFSFNIVSASAAYSEVITWNPANGMASLILTPTGGSAITTPLGQVNPGTVFSVSASTITNTNAAGQKLFLTTVNTDGSQIDTVYNYGGTTIDTVTTLNSLGQQTVLHYDNADGSQYTSYTNPTTQAAIANFSVNANGSGYVATNNNQTITFAVGNKASVSIGSVGDTLLSIQTASGTTETLDMSGGQIVSTIDGNVFTYTLANAGGSIDASGNVTITGGGSTIVLPASGSNATFTVGQDSLSFAQNNLQSLASANNAYLFGVTSSVTGYSESISWNPVNGMASLILTPSAGGQALTTSIGQINPGNVLSISGPYITIASSTGAAISSTTVNSDGSQVNIFYNNSATVNETVTSTNAAGQITSIRYDNTNGSTYTSYYTPGTQTIIANRSVNADGSGYIATAYNQTVNFTSSDLFGVSIDAFGNPLITVTPFASNAPAETLYLTSSQITSTINGHSIAYSLPTPAISYDSSGNLTLTASGSTLVLPSNGSNYIFKVGQDTISLDPASVTSAIPNGTGYNFYLNPQGTAAEYVTWDPQNGLATLNMVSGSGQLTSANLGYINPGYILNVSSSLITITNASGVVTNSYAIETNGSIISTVSGITYSFANSNNVLGLASSDIVTISGSGNTVYASPNDTISLTGNNNLVKASTSDKFTISGTGDTVAFSDTASALTADMATLETLAAGKHLASLMATDGGTLTVTVAQALSDAAALSKLTGTYKIDVIDTVANINANLTALTHQFTGAYQLTASDTAAHITASLSALQNITTTLPASSITVSDKGTIEISSSQAEIYASVLAKITGAKEITIAEASTTVNDFYTANVDTITIGSSTITLGTGMGAIVNASSDKVIGNTNDTVSMTSVESGDTISIGTGSTTSLDGGGNTVTATSGDVVKVAGNGPTGTTDIINMSSGTITVATNAHADVSGSGNTITAGQNDEVGIENGSKDTLTIGTGGAVWLNNGTGHVVNAGNGDSVTIGGNGQTGAADIVNMSGGSMLMGANANLAVGGSGDTITANAKDTITIASGGDTITAGAGGDVFNNTGGGTNIYKFGTGFGLDTINNAGTSGTAATGQIAFGTGISDENLWFQKSGNNLLVTQLDTSNQVTISNWFGSNANAEVATFVANGLTLLDSQIAQLVTAMATYATSNSGFNPTTATVMPTNTSLQSAISAAWHSTTTFATSNSTLNLSSGVTVTITGSGDTINASTNDTIIDNGANNILVDNGGNHDVFVGTAANLGTSVIKGFNSTTDAIDVSDKAYVSGKSTITYVPTAGTGNQSGTLTAVVSGATVAKIAVQNGVGIQSFTGSSDGSGGTRIVDPPLATAADPKVRVTVSDFMRGLSSPEMKFMYPDSKAPAGSVLGGLANFDIAKVDTAHDLITGPHRGAMVAELRAVMVGMIVPTDRENGWGQSGLHNITESRSLAAGFLENDPTRLAANDSLSGYFSHHALG